MRSSEMSSVWKQGRWTTVRKSHSKIIWKIKSRHIAAQGILPTLTECQTLIHSYQCDLDQEEFNVDF